jgi:hypothetical protein
VVAGQELTVKVKRIVGSQGEVHVYFATVPGTAMPGVDYEHVSVQLTFAEGETEKLVNIPVHHSASGAEFSAVISGSDGYARIGVNHTASIHIHRNDFMNWRGRNE